jgi:hypothetical protein
LKGVPPAAELRERIAAISTERSILRQLLRIASRREQAEQYALERQRQGKGGRRGR